MVYIKRVGLLDKHMKELINLKIDPKLKKYLDDRSKKENRARNNLIETILIKEMEKETGKPFT